MLKSIFANAGLLLSGKGAAGVMSIIYLAVAARTLGPASFGALILIHSYAMAVAGMLTAVTWEAVIRFGSVLVNDEDKEGLQKLLSFTVALDLITGIVAAVIAFVAIPWATGWLGLPEDLHGIISLYCITIPFLKQSTPLGLLRLFDHFRPLAVQLTVMPLVRLIGVFVCLYLDLGLKSFVTLWLISGILHGLSIWALGIWAFRKANLHTDFKLKTEHLLKGRYGWWSFVLKTSASQGVNTARQQLSVLLVGGVLGVSAAGFYRLGSDIANFISKPATLLTQTVYPELARLAANLHIRLLRSSAYKSGAIAGTVAIPPLIIIIFFGADIIQLIAGAEFRAAASITTLVTIARMIELYGFAFEPALLSLGRAGAILLSKSAATVVHIGLLAWLMPVMGLEGAGVAIISSTVLLTGVMAWMISTNWVAKGLIDEGTTDDKTGL